ncbi:EamA family transporter [Aegicerativicinus sediminis]
MIFLSLSVLASTLIFVVFKLLQKLRIDNLQAIVINYIAASVFGFALASSELEFIDIFQKQWIWGSLILGALFITIFNVMAYTSQINGIAVASVATKMSLIIPVILGLFLYQENTTLLKFIGVGIALTSVYLTSFKKGNATNSITNLGGPITLFIGSGIIDSAIKYYQFNHLQDFEYGYFSASIFMFAGIFGIAFFSMQRLKGRAKFNPKSIPFGIILGVINFGSIFFLLKALNSPKTESATIFSINNVAIVLFSTLIGLFFFNERLLKKNWVGIALAIAAIFIIQLA